MFMNSEEKSIIVGSAACATTNAQGGVVCLNGKQGISTAWEILDCSDNSLWLAGQADMVKRGATFMNKRRCYTVSICFVQRTLKVLSKQLQSFAQLQYSPFPRSHEREEWRKNPLGSAVGLLGSSRSCWDRCKVKDLHQKLGFALLCFWERRGLLPMLANCLALVSEQI